MPYAVKKPHPSKEGVMLYHTWDPDGDGYEEIRKFTDEAKANEFAAFSLRCGSRNNWL